MSLQIIEPEPLPPPEETYVVTLNKEQAEVLRAYLGGSQSNCLEEYDLMGLLRELNHALPGRTLVAHNGIIRKNKW